MEKTLFILCSLWIVLFQLPFLHFKLLEKWGILDPLNLQETFKKNIIDTDNYKLHTHIFLMLIKKLNYMTAKE